MDQKQDAETMIVARKSLELTMENTVLITLTRMGAQYNATKSTTCAQPEPMLMAARSKQHALHAQRVLMVSAVHKLQTALLSANPMKKNAPHPEQMITVVNRPLLALFKNVITTVNSVPYIVQVYAMKVKSCVQVNEMIAAAKNPLSVNLYPKNFGVMM